jgi:hypothetical protein
LNEFNVFLERRQWIALCQDEEFESEEEEGIDKIENEGWLRFQLREFFGLRTRSSPLKTCFVRQRKIFRSTESLKIRAH